jgi:hypothetical protein
MHAHQTIYSIRWSYVSRSSGDMCCGRFGVFGAGHMATTFQTLGRYPSDKLGAGGTLVCSHMAELPLGWIVHYSVSMIYAVIYWLLIQASILQPTWTDGFLFGAASVVVPWFYFMPCMGKGVMGKLTPNPAKACWVSLLSHLVYGTAMGAGFGWVQMVLN